MARQNSERKKQISTGTGCLVAAIVGEWSPEKYRDEYHEDVTKLVNKKVESGQTKALPAAERPARPQGKGKVVDIINLLREGVNKAGKSVAEPRRRKAS